MACQRGLVAQGHSDYSDPAPRKRCRSIAEQGLTVRQPMFRYTNDKYGFQIDFPDDWGKSSGFARMPMRMANLVNNADIREEFTNQKKEFFNIVIQAMQPEIPPDIAEMIFQTQALERRYTDIAVGRIYIEGREHTWATYAMTGGLGFQAWSKKYMIVLNGYGYALTASCPREHAGSDVEQAWDRIASSFKLTGPLDRNALILNGSKEAQQAIAALRIDVRGELERARYRALVMRQKP